MFGFRLPTLLIPNWRCDGKWKQTMAVCGEGQVKFRESAEQIGTGARIRRWKHQRLRRGRAREINSTVDRKKFDSVYTDNNRVKRRSPPLDSSYYPNPGHMTLSLLACYRYRFAGRRLRKRSKLCKMFSNCIRKTGMGSDMGRWKVQSQKQR